MSFLPGLMDNCTECARHLLCVMGRPVHFCVLCRCVIDLEAVCMQGRNHTYDPPSVYYKTKWQIAAKDPCTYIYPTYPDLCHVAEDKILAQVGRESIMLSPTYAGSYWTYIKLSFGYLGYCGPCREVWAPIVEAGRWEHANLSEEDIKALKRQIGSWK